MPLFNESVAQKLTELLGDLKSDVQLAFFTQEIECQTCAAVREFVEEISSLSDKLHYQVYDLLGDKEKAAALGVDKIPAIVVLDQNGKDHGIRFYGMPGGYEINSFLGALHEVGGNSEPLPDAFDSRIKKIDRDVHIQVFVTATCPHCPGAVATAHRLALENPHVTADMVDASVFPELTQKYRVMGVPKIVINEDHELVGNQPLGNFLDTIEQM